MLHWKQKAFNFSYLTENNDGDKKKMGENLYHKTKPYAWKLQKGFGSNSNWDENEETKK